MSTRPRLDHIYGEQGSEGGPNCGPCTRHSVGLEVYAHVMSTKIRKVTEAELLARRAEILEELGVTDDELRGKVGTGGLAGREWSAWSEIEDIDYLLERD